MSPQNDNYYVHIIQGIRKEILTSNTRAELKWISEKINEFNFDVIRRPLKFEAQNYIDKGIPFWTEDSVTAVDVTPGSSYEVIREAERQRERDVNKKKHEITRYKSMYEEVNAASQHLRKTLMTIIRLYEIEHK